MPQFGHDDSVNLKSPIISSVKMFLDHLVDILKIEVTSFPSHRIMRHIEYKLPQSASKLVA